ncbi:MAG: biopolymer transporter ExbD [Gammaproteobacteria bacterium]|nr:biopolymer transporter ExbD [Gammaproteobacteria bacterium]
MKFQSRPREELDVNIAPLIDVVFLLLIFFMVSTTFQRESELKVSLPEATANTLVEVQPLQIVINATGDYFIGGQELVNNQLSTLVSALAKLSSANKDLPLVIRADAQTPHQAVITAMDAAAQLGLVRLSIATTRSSE